MFLMAMVAAAGIPVPATDQAMTAAYVDLCTRDGGVPQGVLALADREGWRSGGPGAPKGFDPAHDRFILAGDATLELDVRENMVRDERFDTCGITTAGPQAALAADVQAMLGFAPALHIGTSATFYATRENGVWKDASKLTRAEFAAAKAAGKFYSVVAGSTGTSSTVFSLRIRPAGSD
jgi:hypothetical protein